MSVVPIVTSVMMMNNANSVVHRNTQDITMRNLELHRQRREESLGGKEKAEGSGGSVFGGIVATIGFFCTAILILMFGTVYFGG